MCQKGNRAWRWAANCSEAQHRDKDWVCWFRLRVNIHIIMADTYNLNLQSIIICMAERNLMDSCVNMDTLMLF